MTNFIVRSEPFYPSPLDCDGKRINCGDTVYIPMGWAGRKPNQWKPVEVCGVCTINGKWYLDIDGYDITRIPDYVCCREQPVSQDGTYIPKGKANA